MATTTAATTTAATRERAVLSAPPVRRWPVVLEHGDVRLRPLRRRDARTWRRLRADNAAWLQRWEPTNPDGDPVVRGYGAVLRDLSSQARAGRALPFAIEHQGSMVGQLTVGAVVWGSMRSAQVGYWLDEGRAGRGIAPTAVALAVDHCLRTGLHRLEVNIRPENAASLRVVEKLGLREEGLRRRYLHIDGDWRDHRSFAVTAEEAGGGLLARISGEGS